MHINKSSLLSHTESQLNFHLVFPTKPWHGWPRACFVPTLTFTVQGPKYSREFVQWVNKGMDEQNISY